MNILVTGVNGLIGGAVNVYLSNIKEYTVWKIGRNNIKREKNFILADLEESDLQILLKNKQFDCIIHCAASIPISFEQSEHCYTINTKIDKNVILYAQKTDAHLIYMSSASLYGYENINLKKESSKLNITSEYSREKYETEILIQNLITKYTIFRISSPYGSNQVHNTVLKKFIENIFNKRDIMYFGTGGRTQDFVHSSDIARAVRLCVEYSVTGIFNIASGEPISMKRLAFLTENIFYKTLGYKTEVLQSNQEDPQENVRTNISINKAKQQFNWCPVVSLERGIQDWIGEGKFSYKAKL